MPRPIVFFDTNVVIAVARGTITEDDWSTVKRYISSAFSYRLSPLTLVELLMGIRRGDDAHFEQNREPVKILTSFGGRPRFFPFPGAFAGSVIFGRHLATPRFEPEDFEGWLTVVLRARNRGEVQSGVELPGRVRTLNGLDLATLERDLEAGNAQHVERLERVRAGRLAIPTRMQWGYLLEPIGISMANDEEALRVGEAFDAAYVLDCRLFELARDGRYDFAEHDSDFLDMNQLLFLCHPEVHMVTMERKLPGRIAASTQRARVLRFVDILEHARAAAARGSRS